MSFTNQALGALGTATGALAAGSHIAEQKKSVNEQQIANEQAKIANKLGVVEKAEQIELQTQQEINRFNEINQEGIGIEKEATGLHTSLSDKKLRTSKGQFYSQKAMKEIEDKSNEIRLQKDNFYKRIKLLDEKRDLIGKLGVEL